MVDRVAAQKKSWHNGMSSILSLGRAASRDNVPVFLFCFFFSSPADLCHAFEQPACVWCGDRRNIAAVPQRRSHPPPPILLWRPAYFWGVKLVPACWPGRFRRGSFLLPSSLCSPCLFFAPRRYFVVGVSRIARSCGRPSVQQRARERALDVVVPTSSPSPMHGTHAVVDEAAAAEASGRKKNK